MSTSAPIPADEAERLDVLRRYAVLDSPPEACFDRIVDLARRHFGVPIALVSLVDEGRQWFKARCGIDVPETPRDIAFCAHAILQDNVLVVLDAESDPRFASNPLVTDDPGVRFYAGAPLITPGGYKIGTLCLIDTRPRSAFGADERRTLADLAAIVVDELEMRAATGDVMGEIAQRVDAQHDAARATRLLQDALETVGAGIAIYGPDERMRLCNRHYWRSYFGDAPMPSTLPTFECVIRQAVTAGMVEELGDAAAEEQEAWVRERVGLFRNGEVILERRMSNGRHLLIEHGVLADGGRVIVQTDVSEIKQRETALRHAEAFLRAILDNVQDGVVAVDEDGDFSLFNEAAQRMHGLEGSPPHPDRWREHFEILSARGSRVLDREKTPLHRALAGETVAGDVVIVSPKNGNQRLVEAHGQQMRDADGRLLGAVVSLHDITIEQAAEARYADLYNKTPVMLQSIDRGGRLISVSDHWLETLGYERKEVLGRKSSEFLTEESRVVAARVLAEFLETGICNDVEYRMVKKNGDVIDVLLSAVAEYDGAGEFDRSLSVLIDVTERKVIERELIQAQKMEAIGQLTGGMAHDFNNLLAVVMGNLQLLERDLAPDGKTAKRIGAALDATHRGAELTRRLLAFARKQNLAMEAVDANLVVRETRDLLARTLGEQVDLRLDLDDGVWWTTTDEAQLQAALINLAVNARDAMPHGGRLTIESANITVDAEQPAPMSRLAPGQYVVITVADTGEGMPEAVKAKAFEPFFTTKEVGRGTGLGLSMVFGFAKQSGGHVLIDSEVGHGTAVRIFLPRGEAAGQTVEAVSILQDEASGQGEVILVVEDNADVREVALRLLADLDYTPLEAPDGASALAVIDGGADIDLLFTDIVMPGGLNGVELAKAARERQPGLKVLFASGYADASMLSDSDIDLRHDLISKPYRREELAERIRTALQRRQPRRRAA